TIRGLADRGARVVVVAHLGRPKGAVRPGLSLRPVADRLAGRPGRPAACAPAGGGPSAQHAGPQPAAGGGPGLGGLRLEAAETSKDDAERSGMAARLADLADLYVSDGFGVVHRKQASVYDVARLLPHAAGGLVLAEAEAFDRVLRDPARPYVVVLGG